MCVCPVYSNFFQLDPNKVMDNNQLVFDVAQKEFDIKPLMTPQDMASSDGPDKSTMVAYLNLFYEYFRKESLRPAKGMGISGLLYVYC